MLLALNLLVAAGPAAALALGRAAGTTEAGPQQGDPQRGRAIAMSRSQGLCVLCHGMPGVPANEAATIGPSLERVASRHGPSELRERFLNPQRYNPDTVMPGYAQTDHPGARLPESRKGRPLLDEQALADVLAYLATLK